MRYFIITGTSRGLGKAIAKALIQKGHHVFCISRTVNNELKDYAKVHEGKFDYLPYNLSNLQGLRNLMFNIFSSIDLKHAESISLINNAGILSPIKPLEECRDSEILSNLHVNLAAPLILTSEFISRTKEFVGEKTVINISSGAGSKPHYGWSNYCASKAGVNLFTQSVGIEQEERKHPVKILALAPAIMDTTMQEEIRGTDKKNFIEVEKFKDYKTQGKLLTPEQVAEVVRNLLLEGKFENGDVVDVRDLIE